MDTDLFGVFDECEDEKNISSKRKLENDKNVDDDIMEIIALEDDEVENSVKRAKGDAAENSDQKDDEREKLEDMTPRVCINSVESPEGCLHEVITPVDIEYIPLRDMSKNENHKPAKHYDFTLDSFQKEAIVCIENNQSVLVSAHTSSGKTVVAEYAIAQSLRDKQRVIYTTPIKALSNQKYREFYEEFHDVGLITGDVTINPTASCLIMTTEILRLMLFRGSEIMREVGWVIFDEIHYMRDRERGVVWEETIILLPDNVHYVFLSATIPNARQFAEWICHLHHQICHVVYTDFRPVPLQHYIFPAGGDGLHLVVDEQGTFREDNFNIAMSSLQNSGDAAKGDSGNRGRKGGFKGDSDCFKVIRTIMERNLAPVIIFSFSKRECEAYALKMSKLDFNTPAEKDLVAEVFNNAIDVLSEEDKKLPQVEHVLPLLKRGVGIHHSGLLPIIKETIEILFGEGLIKALFATETFAMGLNMPARTVVFTNAHKFDGTDFRWITSGEYIQMSGRAGRRGIDDRGIVILMIDEKMSPSVGKDLIKGKPDPINSAFHLTYNMVLNLLRVEDVNPEYMLQHSFYQFQHYAEVPELLDKLKALESQYEKIEVKNEQKVGDYFKIKSELSHLSKQFLNFLRKPTYIVPFLQAGRLLKIVSDEDVEVGWGVVINYLKKTSKKRNPTTEEIYIYTVDILINVDSSAECRSGVIKPPPPGHKGEMRVVTFSLDNISQISSVRVYTPHDLKSHDNRESVRKALKEVYKKFDNKVPLLDPIEDMNIKDKEFVNLIAKIESYEKRLLECENIDTESLESYSRKQAVSEKVKKVKADLKKAQSLLQMDELRCRKRVLRRLGYCTAADVIEIKGRVACEITSGDELMISEMLFNGLFNDLNIYQINALLSCFVFEEKTEKTEKLTDELAKPLRQMQELAKRIATVSKEAKLDIDENAYVESFRPNLMDVVYAWSKGQSFAHLCKMTDAFEGSIIRCLRRLEELLRQMCQAAKVIGNTDLENKFSEANKVIKRDIVFAASLYL
ncbi:superkiller viralicidic activity 2-like 2 [Leptotrombidium deliense]|uniref:Exosome RNA helicase MTR4 n=1 Tax=Leptotrombidium deliense TaxID=299467 RepID=A0A443SIF5_9ACAR|nr:superkiller viralicidic activity 2-like 2 [Leptotrombidium deliense]